ncbi:MAG: ATP-dependent DNA helicase RecQ [Bacteroidota bacterium]
MTPLAALQQYWGHSTFRPLQQEIIQAVLADKDVLALLPTGGGKSICFQIPTLIRPGLCLVVSPLIALMKDQVDQLKQRGIAAEAVFSGMQPREIDSVLDNCIYGQVKFLYVSPERLKTELLQERVKKMQVSLLAVDEAHCISQWGYDFRPAYLEIAAFKALLPNANTIALTATATPQVQQDIQDKLQFRHTAHFQKSFARNNLAYVVRKTEDKDQQLLNILRQVPGTAIVYVNTRKKTQTIAQILQRSGLQATAYHAGLSTQVREERQEAWLKGTTRVMVATNAFGMGIDKPNVRSVIHLDLPTTLEAYYQEAGRSGRDEKKAYAIVLYDEQDVALLLESIRVAHPTLAQIKRVYQCLANYYQVAVGSHDMVTYDFDWEGFVHTYGLPAQTSYHALKILEREGLIQLNEIFFQPAQVYIDTPPQALYAFQVAQAAYDPLIKALLRLYGGDLFSAVGNISVQRLAHLLNTTPQAVHKQLQALDQQAVLQYYPQKDQPQLTFTTARHPADKLPLDTASLQQKATIATEKAQAVVHYTTHQHHCRAQLLLAYFGEETDQRCGQCDVCLEKQKHGLTEAAYQKYRVGVLQGLQAGPQDLKQLVASNELNAESSVLATIRQMLDQREVIYDEAGRIALKKAPTG